MPIHAARQLPQQIGGGISGADYQDGLLRAAHATIQAAFLPYAVKQPAATHEPDKKHGVQNQYRSRDRGLLAYVYARDNKQGRSSDRQKNALQVMQARIAPDSAVKAGEPEYGQIYREDPRQHRHSLRQIAGRNVQVEPQPIRCQPSDCDRRDRSCSNASTERGCIRQAPRP
jgi:hypothetical protein